MVGADFGHAGRCMTRCPGPATIDTDGEAEAEAEGGRLSPPRPRPLRDIELDSRCNLWWGTLLYCC